MFEAVLNCDFELSYRRNRLTILRWCYGGWCAAMAGLLLITLANPNHAPFPHTMRPGQIAEISGWLLKLFAAQQFLVIFLLTPALAAGAITDEKTRGTLMLLLIATSRPGEIILGKFLSRAAQMNQLVLAAAPVLFLLGAFADVDLGEITILFATLLLTIFGMSALSLLVSVICRQTRDAMLLLYLLTGIATVCCALHALGMAPFVIFLDPITPLFGESLGEQLLRPLFLWGMLTLVCLTLSSLWVRPFYLRQLHATPRKPRVLSRSGQTNIGSNPVEWKERVVEGIAPLAVLRRLPRWVGVALVAFATMMSCCWILYSQLQPPSSGLVAACLVTSECLSEECVHFARYGFLVQGMSVALLASFLVAVRGSGAVTRERETQTIEQLLMTPLTAKEIVFGKWTGICVALLPYLVAYAVVALPMSSLAGIEAVYWTAICIVFAFVLCICICATALWCSASVRTTWRSLLETLLYGYVLGPLIFVSAVSGTTCLAFLVLLYSGWFYEVRESQSQSAVILASASIPAIGFLWFSRHLLVCAARQINHVDCGRPLP